MCGITKETLDHKLSEQCLQNIKIQHFVIQCFSDGSILYLDLPVESKKFRTYVKTDTFRLLSLLGKSLGLGPRFINTLKYAIY